MATYRMIQWSHVISTDLPWQYDFDMASAKLAIEYAGKISCYIQKDLLLYVHRDDWYPVAEITQTSQTTYKARAVP